ncbi:hypothetical protein N8089_02350 [Flavobacteriales bacterium]|nr:hypothetical protein [Flavobacteriales bacterium]
MANKQDIITAIKNLDIFLKVPELKGAKVKLNKNGSPFAFAGGFNMVFQLNHNQDKWAFRVWHVPMGNHNDRYKKISEYLCQINLPYFADFIYDSGGLLVNGEFLDTIRMKWLSGKSLKSYLKSQCHNQMAMRGLLKNLLEMFEALHDANISHGDLQGENILIEDNGDVRLIDYDSLYTPNIEGSKELVFGKKGYQHPSRFYNKTISYRSDYFSELVIYLSVLAISENPKLFELYEVEKTEYLLFSENDFIDICKSNIYKDLMSLSDNVKSHLKALEFYLKEKDFKKLSPFPEVLNALFKDPQIAFFTSDTSYVKNSPHKTVQLKWKTAFTNKVEIIGVKYDLPEAGQLNVDVERDTTFTLKVYNALGKIDKHSIKVEVSKHPPNIREFNLSNYTLTGDEPSILKWEVKGAKKIDVSHVGENIKTRGEQEIHFLKDTPIKLRAWSHFNVPIEKEILLKVSKKPPEIKKFSSNFEYVFPNQEIQIFWEVEVAKKIDVFDTDGNQMYSGEDLIHSISHKVFKQNVFKIRVENIFGFVSEKELMIITLPTPSIEKLVTAVPEIKTEIKFETIKLDTASRINLNVDVKQKAHQIPSLSSFNSVKLDMDVIQPPKVSNINIGNENLLSKLTKSIRNEIKKYNS